MRILMVLTSHGKLGSTGAKTGFWLEEFAAPYYVFTDSGATVTLASPLGEQPPLDPKSDTIDAQSGATERFKADSSAQSMLAHTHLLRSVSAEDFDAVFYPGGRGLLWDLVDNWDSITLIESLWAAGKPVAAVCHAPAVLKHAKQANGMPLVLARNVTGFANSEEQAAGLAHVVPISIEDTLRNNGAYYSRLSGWQAHVAADGMLITGQNPASSELAAKALLEKLQ